MQNSKEFLILRRFCREQGFAQRLSVHPISGKKRRMNSRHERVFDEDEGIFVPKRIPIKVTSRHFINLGSTKLGVQLMVHVPRSNKERTKSLEAFIEAIQQHGNMPEIVALLRSMRGVKRGRNVFWYCDDETVEAEFSYADYLQLIANEMAVN